MPVPPKTPILRQARCLKCGWQRTWVERTDVWLPAPKICPKCGGTVTCKQVDGVWDMVKTLFGFIK